MNYELGELTDFCWHRNVNVTGHVNGTTATGALVIPESVKYNAPTYSVVQ